MRLNASASTGIEPLKRDFQGSSIYYGVWKREDGARCGLYMSLFHVQYAS